MQEPTSWEECDRAYVDLVTHIRGLEVKEILSIPLSKYQNLRSIAHVSSELLIVTYWSNSLMYFRIGRGDGKGPFLPRRLH
jgi:hypothetical protein